MQQQKQQPTHAKPKIDVKRITLYARIVLFVVILLGAIVTGILFVMTGAAVYGGLTGFIALVATVIAVYPILVPAQSASNTASTSPIDIQSGSVKQSTEAKTDQPIFFFNLPLHDPNEFYGRNAARTTLIARTANGGSSSIVGERRAGKTWLLEYLRLVAPTHDKLGQAYRIACISAEHPRCKSLAGVVEWVLEELSIPRSSHDLGLQPLDQLSQGMRTLKKLGIIPVLCIDEFEGFDNKQEFNNDFVDGLRAMAQNDGLVLVTASKLPLRELVEDLTGQTSPLFNIVQQIPLSPFTEQEAREFMSDKSDMAGFTKKERDFFLSRSTFYNSNGEPYWPPLRLQLVGQMLLDDKQTAQRGLAGYKLDDVHYQSEFERRLNETYWAVVRHTK